MALHKKYADLPGLDSAPDIYETPDLTDGDSTVPCVDEARSLFMPTNLDARDVDFSDRVDSKRKSYKASRRRHRVFEDGTEEFGDLSDDEDDEESLVLKIARLRRTIMEVKEEYGKHKAAGGSKTTAGKSKTTAGESKTPDAATDAAAGLDDEITSLSQALEEITQLNERETATWTATAHQTNAIAENTAPVPPNTATYTIAYAPRYEQTHALAKAADFDRRLLLLEKSLGIGSSAMPGLDAGGPPRAVVPALETLQKQLSTLEGASTSSLDTISRRVRALIQEVENLEKARRGAKAAQDALASTGAAPAAAPESAAGDSESAQQTAKINALYGTLPTIESLTPLLPPLLDRLRSLRAIHADAATASETLDQMEKRQAEMAGDIKQWKEGLDKVEAAIQSAETSMADNMKVMEGWVEDLETKIDFARVFTYATKLDCVLMVGAVSASVGAGITVPVMNLILGSLAGDFDSFGAGLPKDDFSRRVDRMSFILCVLFLARFALVYAYKLCFRLIGLRMSAAIRLDYLRSLLAQSVHVLDSMPSGTGAATITSTANTLQLGISEKLGILVEYNATIVGAIFVALSTSGVLTLVTGTAALFIGLVLSVLLPRINKVVEKSQEMEAMEASFATEAFAAIRMVTSCGAEGRIAAKHAERVRNIKQASQGLQPLLAAQFGLVILAVTEALPLAFGYGTKLFHERRIDSVSAVVVIVSSIMLIMSALERTAPPLMAASKAMVAAAEFFDVIDAPKPPRGTLKEPDVTATGDIVFREVEFAYPSRPSKKVLDRLSLRIEANKKTAIVGPSGSGKSTIVGLLQGWYSLQSQHTMAKTVKSDGEEEEEEEKKKKRKGEAGTSEEKNGSEDESDSPVALRGSIETCGHTLDEVDVKWWRAQIGLVQQEPFLFDETIFTNVSAGLIGSEWEDASEQTKRELVKQACAESFADEFIDRLPDGYDTQVGQLGAKLSGGQRQRIAIARSIIKKPKILILDEATSAIDVQGERVVQAALERASKGRTTVTIAHRLSTIKDADRIVVLQGGRVAQEGTHESLLADEEGAYWGLVHAQTLWLSDDGDDGGRLEEEDVDDGDDGDGDDDDDDDDDVSTLLGDGVEDGDKLAKEDIKHAWSRREKSAARSEADSSTKKTVACEDGNLFKGFFKLLSEQHSQFPLLVFTLIFTLGAGATVPLQACLSSHGILSFLQTGADTAQHPSSPVSLFKIWVVAGVAIGLCYFSAVAGATHIQSHVAAVYQQEYFESILYQKTSYFDAEDNTVGQLTARLAGDPKALQEMLGINMMVVLIGIFSLTGALAISFACGWKLALLALGATVPLVIAAAFYRVHHETQFNAMNEAVFRESSKFGAEAIGAFRTVCSLVMEDSICTRYDRLLRGHASTAYRKARLTTLVFALSDSVIIGCQAVLFWYGSRLVLSHEYPLLNFFMTYIAMMNGAESAGMCLSFGPNAAQASAAANRILALRQSRNRDAFSRAEQIPDTEGGVRIELRDVGFQYPTRDMPVFSGLNITVEKGQFVALVGASGSGKSTVVELLQRFYDVDKGQILFNGKDIRDVNVYEYRKLMSLVAQDPALLQGTIRENVLLGVDPAQVTDEQLYQCCRDANIHDFILSLPDGYNTDIGSKGITLSGGQKQRISIARALVRNPRVLLLDEATSAMDSENERLVQAAFERVAKGRTILAVAHRLATIQHAHVIYVLGEGKLLEKGSHRELLRQKGAYWHMCHNQAFDTDIQARRAKAGKLVAGTAAYSDSDMFKAPPPVGMPTARRWDHHLSHESRLRAPCVLKQAAAKHLSKPGLISLGGGLPRAECFPLESLSMRVPRPPHFSEAATRTAGQDVRVAKYDTRVAGADAVYDLAIALNYGQASGSAQMLRWVTEHTELVCRPPYADWRACLTVGSTGALEQVLRMLCDPGRADALLTEEYSFSTALETAAPMGIRTVGVRMDDQGLLPESMDEVLGRWDRHDGARLGSRKPHVLYTVPSGQNPTGATQGEQRRRDIYEVARMHDVLVIEDEPYYFLQLPPYRKDRGPRQEPEEQASSVDPFLDSLIPSLVSMDVDGRVLRMDSFSKVVVPGSRLGWLTASEQIIERFLRHAEVCNQGPSGFSQVILHKLLDEVWGHEGYLRWLMSLRDTYAERRDMMLDACEAFLPAAVVSWTQPSAGMFHWLKVDHTQHPDAANRSILEMEEDIFNSCIDKGVLVGRGSWFRTEHDKPPTGLFFRATYAAASPEDMAEAIRRFGQAVRESYRMG
ncbi:hypothetical protein P8C59_007341 [Phyllachora maydis]|uniref:aromatic-amino-acid transaminase n=1 Tax=Phyllachora maydis TaxID=1825666 RepID=A0AAD9I9Z2_9PEZI|nr:hypothetical protein P8C59_007341 [Phyllachora maydis]